MKTGPKGAIWIISKNKSAIQFYKDLLEKDYRVVVFPSVPLASGVLPQAIIFDSLISRFSAAEKASIPIIFFADSDDLEILRKAYRDGASEILVKPIRANELITRLEKIVQPAAPRNQDIQFDPIKRKVWGSGNSSSELTHRELQIFLSFHNASKHTLRRQEIISQVWGKVQVGNKTLDVHLFNLRKKISDAGFRIHFSPPDIFTLLDDSARDK